MQVLMINTLAHPDYILSAGDVYDMPRQLAKKILAHKSVLNAVEDGKGGATITAGPSVAVEYDPERHGKKTVRRVPLRPDPEDRPDVEEDDFEMLEDSE